jgi:hypothetical protein
VIEVLGIMALVIQSSAPTVGDTVWLSRVVRVPPGHVVRAADWEPEDPVELLGRPRVVSRGDSAEISYPVALWRPGQHLIEVPGPLLLRSGGTVDSLGGERVPLTVRSVLPSVPRDSVLRPQPRASVVWRSDPSLLPLIVLWCLGLVILIPLHLWWRRRGPAVPSTYPSPSIPEPPLDRWADAGEYRAVAGVAASRLRNLVAQRVAGAHPGLDTERFLAEIAAARPTWPLEELGELLRKLDAARFGNDGNSSQVLQLSAATLELSKRLHREAA